MNIKALREKKHLSQEQLAKMAGLNVRTIQRIENGASASLETLKCLAAALDVDINSLTTEQPPDAVLASHQALLTSKKIENITCIVVAILFILFGQSAVEAEPIITALFWIGAAFCFLVIAFNLAKYPTAKVKVE